MGALVSLVMSDIVESTRRWAPDEATLAGVGGMGKTRLAAEVAAGAAQSYADGAWWIDLSAATSEDAVLPVAMTAADAREIPGRTRLWACAVVDRSIARSMLTATDTPPGMRYGQLEMLRQFAEGAVIRGLVMDAPSVNDITALRDGIVARVQNNQFASASPMIIAALERTIAARIAAADA